MCVYFQNMPIFMVCVSAATVTTIPLLMFAGVLSCMQAPTIDLESQTAVTGYTVFHKESSAGDFIEVTLADVTTFTIPTPVPLESTYEVKVAASNSGGTSAASELFSKGKCVTILVK